MGLHLHYVDAVAHHLHEILAPLIQKHFNFKLEDSFRIVVPHQEWAADLEEVLLEDPQAGKVLLGKSVLTFSAFSQALLKFHPHIRPIAPLFLERKAFRLALQIEQAQSNLDPHAQRRYLYELKRWFQLYLLSYPRQNKARPPSLFQSYQTILSERFQFWSPEQAMEQAWDLVKRRKCALLEKVQDLYFLGFDYPDGALARCIEALILAYPEINLYLFIPPPPRLLDRKEVLGPILDHLERLADNKILHTALDLPEIQAQAYRTPLHEAHALLGFWNRNPDQTGIFTPFDSASRGYLEKLIHRALDLGGPYPDPAQNPSLASLEILNEFENDSQNESPVYFTSLLKILIPRFQKAREILAEENNLSALTSLEAAYRILQDFSHAETVYQELRPQADWVEELREAFTRLRTASPDTSKRLSLRFLERAGLRLHDNLHISNLNEGTYPAPGANFSYLELSEDPFYLHQKKLAFEQALYLTRGKVVISYVEHSMAGRTLLPSLFLEDLGIKPFHPPPQDFVIFNKNHPYHLENVKREHQRKAVLGPDSGNLNSLPLQEKMLGQIEKRPLSPSYLDDYAKCPWRFFARWQLGLEELPAEDLEVEPKLRGKLAHDLLDRIYTRLIAGHFSKEKLPSLDEMKKTMTESVQEIWASDLRDNPDIQYLPRKVLQDELKRIESQVEGVLNHDFETWTLGKDLILPEYVEWRFGRTKTKGVPFSVSPNLTVFFAGAIDRIDINRKNKEFLVIDYKSSGSETLGRELREIKSFQLFIYLYAVKKILLQEFAPVGALYWDLKKQRKNQGLAVKSIFSRYFSESTRSRAFLKDEEYERLKAQIQKELASLLQRLTSGDFSLNPPDCQGSRCPYHAICRYENQPA